MEDHNTMVVMSKLVEIIFGKKSSICEEKAAQSSFRIRENMLTEDFSKKINDILTFRRLIISCRYKGAFDSQSRRMLSSHENYLTYVFFACLLELENNQSIFESFISVCAFVININFEIFTKTGLDFHDLNSDIFVVFYRKVLKKSFLRRKGLDRFFEYVRDHKYLTWNRNRNDNIDVTFEPYVREKIHEELKRYGDVVKVPFDAESAKMETARSLAREVLSTTTVELPTLLSESDLIARLVAYGKNKKMFVSEVKNLLQSSCLTKTSPKDSSLNSDAETNCFAKQQDDAARHESIIRAVVKYNHSKNSDDDEVNDQICKKADGILSHLRNTIESLTEVLDELNKENEYSETLFQT